MNGEVQPVNKHIEIGLIANEFPRVSFKERLLSDFHYDISILEQEMRRVVDEGARFRGYPEQGLTMTEGEYDLWVAHGKRVERLIGYPGHRPQYFVEHHPNRYDKQGNRKSSIVTPVSRAVIVSHPEITGTERASDGTLLNPYLRFLLTQTKRGLPTGPGFYWDLGPMRTVDTIVFRIAEKKLQILLVKRMDGGGWSLPGGHVESEDKTLWDAAKRETKEETDISGLDRAFSASLLRHVPVADWRMTAQSWPETSVFLSILTYKEGLPLLPKGRSDATEAAWMCVAGDKDWKGVHFDNLFASHNSYVKLAILSWQELTGYVVRSDGVVGKSPPFERVLNSFLTVRSLLVNTLTKFGREKT